MGHMIRHLTYRKTSTTPKKILKSINEWAYDPQETSCYHGNLTFHEKPVYKSIEEAAEAVKKLDNGWYDDHAVLFKNGRTLYWFVKVEYHC